MITHFFANPEESGFRVYWEEADGYTRERNFASYRAAERFARQLECRLQIDAAAASAGSRSETER